MKNWLPLFLDAENVTIEVDAVPIGFRLHELLVLPLAFQFVALLFQLLLGVEPLAFPFLLFLTLSLFAHIDDVSDLRVVDYLRKNCGMVFQHRLYDGSQHIRLMLVEPFPQIFVVDPKDMTAFFVLPFHVVNL